jgi:hypothetical protein
VSADSRRTACPASTAKLSMRVQARRSGAGLAPLVCTLSGCVQAGPARGLNINGVRLKGLVMPDEDGTVAEPRGRLEIRCSLSAPRAVR